MQTLVLNGGDLTINDVVAVARQGRPVALGPEAVARMAAARQVVEQVVAGDKAVYGINTGFGSLSCVRIPHDQLAALQRNLVRSHAAGVGPPLSVEVVRAMLLLLAASLARGHSGVRPLLAERLCTMLNHAIHPLVPSRGSVGSSGDLAPLAHIALTLIGEGQVWHSDERDNEDVSHQKQSVPAATALAAVGLEPLTLQPKEGLALINGTHMMAGYGALLVHDGEVLLHTAEVAMALSLEATRGSAVPFDSRIHMVRHQSGQRMVAERIRVLTNGSEILLSHPDCGRVQDPYSLRCAPQVLGAVQDGLGFAKSMIERELGAVTDNPLCFPDDSAILSGGNFHGQPLALSLDIISIVLTQLAAIAERRIYLMISAQEPGMGLPPALTRSSGVESGLMIAQYTAAALVNECQALASPASVNSIPTSAGMEDFNSMGATAAHKAAQVLELAQQVLAIELLCAAQGLEFQRPLRAGCALEEMHARIREVVPPLTHDRVLSDDIVALTTLVRNGTLTGTELLVSNDR